jgi:hypothetical protein
VISIHFGELGVDPLAERTDLRDALPDGIGSFRTSARTARRDSSTPLGSPDCIPARPPSSPLLALVRRTKKTKEVRIVRLP